MDPGTGKGPTGKRISGILVLTALVFIHALLLWLMLSRRLDPLFNDAQHRLGPATDFAAYYKAGAGVLAGKGAYGHGPGFGFRYHPLFAAALGVLFAKISLPAAYLIWVLWNEIGFFWIWMRLRALSETPKQFLLFSALLVCFTPYYLEVYMGNASFLCSLLLFVAITLMQGNKHSRASLVLAVSIILKPIGLVMLPWQAMRGRWKDVCLVVLLVLFSAVPFFWNHTNALRHFLTLNFSAVPAEGWVVHGGNQGLHVFLVDLCARLAGIPVGKLSSFAQLPWFCQLMVHALPVLLVGVTLAATRKLTNETYLAAFLWLATYLLGYKDVWEHSYSIAIVALLLARMSGAFPDRLLLVSGLFLALPTAFVFYDVQLPRGPVDPERYWSDAVSFLHHATKWIWIALPYAYATRKLLFRAKVG